MLKKDKNIKEKPSSVGTSSQPPQIKTTKKLPMLLPRTNFMNKKGNKHKILI